LRASLVALGVLLSHGFFAAQAADGSGPLQMRPPLDAMNVSSGFGMRADPFDQPPPGSGPARPTGLGGLRAPALPAGLSAKSAKTNVATALGVSLGLAPQPAATLPTGRTGQALFMHEGVDLAAPAGTPIYAAAEGVVIGAGPNGGYGNWIRIEHRAGLFTVYGHLSGFAPGIASGAQVKQGQLIGFVGSTGRSTGPHLHFEIVNGGKAVDPLTFPGIKTQPRLEAAAR
jgi:murein DD-endopeptidase MepM/ murein hydrolase activator NlpD